MEHVTVIMNSCKEKPEYLKAAIESYLNQLDVKIQLIVSTIENDPCIKYIQTNYPSVGLCIFPLSEHPGRSPQGSFLQINRALPMMKGDWFCFASSNDTALPQKCRIETRLCILSGNEICYSAYNFITADGTHRRKQLFFNYDYQKHFKGNFVSDCAMMSKRIVDKLLPFKVEYNNYAYWDLWLRAYEAYGNCFVYNSHPTWNYRTLANSMHIQRKKSSRKIAQTLRDRDNMLEAHK